MTQRNIVIGAVVLVGLLVPFYLMSRGTPQPEATTDPVIELGEAEAPVPTAD